MLLQGTPLKLSVSEAIDHIKCPTRWKFRWRDLRIPKRRPPAPEIGTGWHLLRKLKAQSPPGVDPMTEVKAQLLALADECRAKGFPKDADELGASLGMLHAAEQNWKDLYTFEIVEVETPIELHLGTLSVGSEQRDVYLVGTPDRIDRFNGQLIHHQYKTVGKNIPIDLYIKTMERNWHENLYPLLIESKHGERPTMFCLDILRKLKPDTINADPSKALRQEICPIDPNIQRDVLNSFLNVAESIARIDAGESPRWSNPLLDRGQFGNSLDPYYNVLIGEASLDDDTLFENAEERYAESHATVE